MKWALVDQNNVIQNIIIPASGPWIISDGLNLVEVNDWLDIGSHTDDSEPTITEEQQSMIWQQAAQSVLNGSDIAMYRIVEAVSLGLTTWTTTDVVAFVNYRRQLRQIRTGQVSGPLPDKPPYPSGT